MKKRDVLKGLMLSGVAALASLTLSFNAMAAELNVGANIGNVPWEFQDASGKIVGFEVDLMTEVGKRLGMDVKFTNIPFQGLFAAVQSGQIDAAVSSITITKKRLESVSFAQPYYDSDQSLTVKADSGIKDLAGMEGKTVGVDTGSTGDMWATGHQDETKIGTISRYEGLSPAMLDLEAGRIDGYISDIPALLYYVKDKPQFAVVERIKTDRAVLGDVRQGRAAGQQGQRRHHRDEEGRYPRQDPRDVVRHQAGRGPGHHDGAGHAEALIHACAEGAPTERCSFGAEIRVSDNVDIRHVSELSRLCRDAPTHPERADDDADARLHHASCSASSEASCSPCFASMRRAQSAF